MNENSRQPREPNEIDPESPAKPEVPPASETWVEGQPESEKDYPQ